MKNRSRGQWGNGTRTSRFTKARIWRLKIPVSSSRTETMKRSRNTTTRRTRRTVNSGRSITRTKESSTPNTSLPTWTSKPTSPPKSRPTVWSLLESKHLASSSKLPSFSKKIQIEWSSFSSIKKLNTLSTHLLNKSSITPNSCSF